MTEMALFLLLWAWVAVGVCVILEYGYKRFKGLVAAASVWKKLAIAALLGPLGLCLFLYFLYLDLIEALLGGPS